jgi:hypothetical protein
MPPLTRRSFLRARFRGVEASAAPTLSRPGQPSAEARPAEPAILGAVPQGIGRHTELVDAILRGFAEHPHHSTAQQIAERRGNLTAVRAAIDQLDAERLLLRAGEHRSLSTAGWRAVRARGVAVSSREAGSQ